MWHLKLPLKYFQLQNSNFVHRHRSGGALLRSAVFIKISTRQRRRPARPFLDGWLAAAARRHNLLNCCLSCTKTEFNAFARHFSKPVSFLLLLDYFFIYFFLPTNNSISIHWHLVLSDEDDDNV